MQWATVIHSATGVPLYSTRGDIVATRIDEIRGHMMWDLDEDGVPVSLAAGYEVHVVEQDDPPRTHTHRWTGAAMRPIRKQEKDAYDEDEAMQAADRAITRREKSLVWEIVDAVNPPVTQAKFDTALMKLKTTYKDEPWLTGRLS